MTDQGTQPLGGSVAQPVASAARTPEQALNLSKLMAGAFTFVPLLLTAISALFTFGLARYGRPAPSLSPVTLAIVGAGVAAALASNYVANRIGMRAAKEWAAAGRSGDSSVAGAAPPRNSTVFGLDIGASAPASAVSSLWDRFMVASLVGCAMAEMAALEGFVATIVSRRFYIMLLALSVSFAFMYLNFPRRATWDRWVADVGLTLPWQRS